MPAEPETSWEEARGDDAGTMGFFEHLEELRRRLFFCLIGIVLCVVLAVTFWKEIYVLLSGPIMEAFAKTGADERLVFTGPLIPIKFALQVGLYGGIFLAAPIIFWQIWLFVAPGLYRHERRFVLPFVIFSSGLFVLGAYFAHRIVLPIVTHFLINFGMEMFTPLITINEYFSLWLTMVLWMGLIFELPVLIFVLSWIGIVTPGFLLHYLRHAILAIAVVSALITPTTDVFTMAVFGLPMVALYLVGIAVAWVVDWRRRARLARARAED